MTAIVFVHGFLGFVRFSMFGHEVRYFRDLADHLKKAKTPLVNAYFPALPATGTVVERARVLADFVGALREDTIAFVAHSMGGLDCRYVIHHFDPERRICSLATIATPHRGSPLARYFCKSRSPLGIFARWYGMPGLIDLTPAACGRFNETVPDRNDVLYESYAGMRPPVEFPYVYRPAVKLIGRLEGENDSQVSVESAKWGDFRGCLRADHLELIGWNFSFPDRRHCRPFDHLSFYRTLVTEIIQRRKKTSA